MFGRLGTTELIVILVIVVVVFGPKNLPKIGKLFGETINNFRTSMKEGEEKPVENADKADSIESKKD